MTWAAANTDRILANLIRFGRIDSVDFSTGTATVDFDGEVIEGLQWAKRRAGDDREYSALSKGEQVCVLSPSGDLSQGIISYSISQDAFPNAGNDANPRVVYSDGTIVEYDKASHTLTVDASASSGHVVIKCNSAKIESPESEITGNLKVGGSLAVNGSSVKHAGKEIGAAHGHIDVEPGKGVSGVVK